MFFAAKLKIENKKLQKQLSLAKKYAGEIVMAVDSMESAIIASEMLDALETVEIKKKSANVLIRNLKWSLQRLCDKHEVTKPSHGQIPFDLYLKSKELLNYFKNEMKAQKDSI